MEHLQLLFYYFGSLAALTTAQTLPLVYNLSSVLSNQTELTSFSSYLNQFPTLLSQLEAGNVTILAPSNNAFTKYFGSAEATSNNTDKFAAILTYHVLNGLYPRILFNSTPQFIPTLLLNSNYANVTGGQRVEVVSLDNGTVFYSAVKAISNLITPDIIYSEKDARGVLHVIDSVLVPPIDMINTVTQARLDGYLALVAYYPPSPRWQGALGGSSDWTLFTPNISRSDVQEIESHPVTQEETFAVQEYNCVHGEVAYSTLLTNGKTFKTVQGNNVTITVQNGSVYVNAAKIIGTDYMISTGVLHVTDSVLNPNDTSARPSAISTSSETLGAPLATNTPTVPSVPSPSLRPGSKAGIGVGAVVGAILIFATAWYFIRRGGDRLKKKESGTVVSELSQGEKHMATELEGEGRAIELE